MLRALFFDVDDTLYSSTQFAESARERAVDAMLARGLRMERARVLQELQGVVAEFSSNDDRHFDRLLERLPASATAGVNKALLVVAGVIAYHQTKWEELRIRTSAQRLLEDLAATELRLGVITSGITKKQMEKILRLGLDRYVDPGLIFITDQQGIAKSNAKLYVRAAQVAGVPPAAAMHVGDHPAHDVDSAKRAGMIAVWHRGGGKYSALEPAERPDHVIDDLGELRALLAEHYAVRLGA
ncbi:MAG: HAD family hydrolase [Planctomycetota bacterium]|nr:MAG: HAD family hydrolase [Planctomycetota bacterium]